MYFMAVSVNPSELTAPDLVLDQLLVLRQRLGALGQLQIRGLAPHEILSRIQRKIVYRSLLAH